MPLTLTLQQESTLPIEAPGVLPELLRGQSLAAIEKLPVRCGNQLLCLADLFRIEGDPNDQILHWQGPLQSVHRIGALMTSGQIMIDGNAGRHLGSQMRGGQIEVQGDAGDWVGAEMRGGSIHVRGNAGHQPGAAYPGSPLGMRGGSLLIAGDAGHEAGRRMRRGQLVVGGSIGDLAGHNMRAGTILVQGGCGIRHGAGMRRGTIALLGDARPPLLSSFRAACRFRPPILAMLFHDLRRRGFPLRDDFFHADFDLFIGDLLEGGRGEIFLRADAISSLGG